MEEYVAEYCRLTGRSGLPDLNWYFAYNIFRLAGIVQGIVGRVRDGTANSPQAAAMAERVPALGEAAWKFAEPRRVRQPGRVTAEASERPALTGRRRRSCSLPPGSCPQGARGAG